MNERLTDKLWNLVYSRGSEFLVGHGSLSYVALSRFHDEPFSREQRNAMSIAIASLILGKAVLIADLLPPINRYPNKPLAYNVAWKTTIYLVVAGVIHYLERVIDFSRQAGGIVPGNEKMLTDMVWPHFWAVQIILFVLILMYCTAHELVRVIGKEKMLRLFFGPTPLPAF